MNTALENATALYMEGIRDGNPREAVAAYTGARYTQHSTGVADGREGFIAFFEPFIERNPVRDIRIVRSWQDGRHVFIQAAQSLNDGESSWLTTDFFDSDDDGKIIEHWDVISALGGVSPSGHTQVDGPTEVTDLEATEANKALVREMLEHCLFRGARGERIEDYVSAETYIQHNREVPDGLEPFRALVRADDRSVNYEEIVLCVGSGNFVATLCRVDRQGTQYAQVDIFRIADGRIVEHWDNAEPVPENDVNSGKF